MSSQNCMAHSKIVMSSEVETSLTISFLHNVIRSTIRDSSTEPVLSKVEGLGMTEP